MNKNITNIIQMIPQILNQAKSQYTDDNSIMKVLQNNNMNIDNVLNTIKQYKNNPVVNTITKQFGVDLEAVENKFSSLLQNNNSTNNTTNSSLDKFR